MKEVLDFKREELFKHFHSMQNPYIIITVPIKVTNLVKYSQIHKHFNALFGYYIGQVVNETEPFRYRYIDNKYYLCDRVGVSFTQLVDETVYFFDCYEETKEKFIKEYEEKQAQVKTTKQSQAKEQQDAIWVSCTPWFKFTALVPPFDKNLTIPQFIWDKYEQKEDEYYCNLLIMVHHGFADGYQVSQFIDKLENTLNNIK